MSKLKDKVFGYVSGKTYSVDDAGTIRKTMNPAFTVPVYLASDVDEVISQMEKDYQLLLDDWRALHKERKLMSRESI